MIYANLEVKGIPYLTSHSFLNSCNKLQCHFFHKAQPWNFNFTQSWINARAFEKNYKVLDSIQDKKMQEHSPLCIIYFRVVQRSGRSLQGWRLLDAQADGRVRGQPPLDGFRLPSHRAHWRAGQVHGTHQDRTIQAKLLQILNSHTAGAVTDSSLLFFVSSSSR